jgi:hypothetical protein
VSAIVLLMGLLLAGYLGSFLVGDRAVRGVGLPSGVEWVAVGLVLGPGVLGVIGTTLLEAVAPVVVIGVGWLSLVVGLDYGYNRGKAVGLRRIVGGIVWGVATAVPVSAAVYYATPLVWPALEKDRFILALCMGAVSAETTRHVMRWVAERHGARGPLFDLLTDLADAEDIVPVLAIGVTLALRATPGEYPLPVVAKLGVTIGLGAVLGALCAWLLGKELRVRESWGFLIGTSLLAIGVGSRAGLSVVAVMFMMGLALSLVSRHSADVRTMVLATERSALVPTMILCGARLHATDPVRLAVIVAVAVVARLTAKWLLGRVVAVTVAVARPAGGLMGLAMLSSGALSLCVGLTCSERFPGPIGDAVLVAAVASCVAGEIFGPPSLRTALKRAGDIVEPSRPNVVDGETEAAS